MSGTLVPRSNNGHGSHQKDGNTSIVWRPLECRSLVTRSSGHCHPQPNGGPACDLGTASCTSRLHSWPMRVAAFHGHFFTNRQEQKRGKVAPSVFTTFLFTGHGCFTEARIVRRPRLTPSASGHKACTLFASAGVALVTYIP